MPSPQCRTELARQRAERKRMERERKKAGRERHKLLQAQQQARKIMSDVDEADDVAATHQWLSGCAVQYPLP